VVKHKRSECGENHSRLHQLQEACFNQYRLDCRQPWQDLCLANLPAAGQEWLLDKSTLESRAGDSELWRRKQWWRSIQLVLSSLHIWDSLGKYSTLFQDTSSSKRNRSDSKTQVSV